ncbi:MAG: hypothetical protein K9L56_13525 [Clostridiales bacterium]|nr:hypothetical protein [Clostridiales bacterium]
MVKQTTGQNAVVTYDPRYTVVSIDGTNYANVNSIEASPLSDDQYTTFKSTTGERAWIRDPEFGAEVVIEFSGGIASNQRETIRNLLGKKVEVQIKDKSQTASGVTLTDARLVQKPTFSRNDSEPTMEATFVSPYADWGASNANQTYDSSADTGILEAG